MVNEILEEEAPLLPDHADPHYVSFAEAAELLGVSRRAVYQAVDAGLLTSYSVMGKKALRRWDVIRHKDYRKWRDNPPSTEEEIDRWFVESRHQHSMEVVECSNCHQLVLLGTTTYKRLPIRIPNPGTGGGLMITRSGNLCAECIKKWDEIAEVTRQETIKAYQEGRIGR